VRVLHAIRPDETLVCRGEYLYLQGGEPTGDHETWLVTHLPDGHEIIRSDIDGRKGTGASLITHQVRTAAGRPEWLRLRFRTQEVNAAAQYTFEPASVRTARLADSFTQRQGLVEIAAHYVVDYHAVIGHDYVWMGYPEDAEGETRAIPIFSPNLWAEGDDLLSGRALRFSITPLDPEPCLVPAGSFDNTSHFSIRLNDGVEALAWYDKMGIPLKWEYPEKGYTFVLNAYRRGE
jgi:hypothetical protein